MRKKILITSALPYANGPLHFGHIAGAYLPADCYARFERLQGNRVCYICGSDEYGIAITLSAEAAGRTPQEQVDLFHEVNKKLFEKLSFSFDLFSRTTAPHHKEITQQFFKELLANGYIEEKITEQLFSPEENRFLADRYVIGTCPKCGYPSARGDECGSCAASFEATDLIDPKSKLTGSSLVKKATKHWFLRLDLFKEKLTHWLSQKNWKDNVSQFLQNYIDDLHPRAITRDGTWGVPIPLEHTEGKIFYVWFDAPIGYISITQEWARLQNNPDLWKEFWCDPETLLVQFIGKDNIPFHGSFFPAMTMGQDTFYKLVDELPANEFYLLEGKQFSKSDGWYIDLERFFTQFSADQIRYTIAANAPETHDTEFTWKDFQNRCNGDLLGKYANFVHRTLVFIKNKCGGKIPPLHLLQTQDQEFLNELHSLKLEIKKSYQSFRLKKAAQHIMELATKANVYFDSKKPWQLLKDPSKHPEMETTLHLCLYAIHYLALTSFPIIPTAAQGAWNLCGQDSSLALENWDTALQEFPHSNYTLPEPYHLFEKIEDSLIEGEIEALKKLSSL